MTFSGINYFAILLAAVGAFAFGSVWYTTLSKPWMEGLGKTKDELQAAHKGAISPFIVTFAAELLMAWVLAGLIGHMGAVTLRTGVISAAFCWLGFVLPTMAANHAFHGSKRQLTLIDGGHWLGVLLIEGAIIGALGVH